MAGPPGIPAGTFITSIGAGTLELSEAATITGPQVLSLGAQPFAVGETISGEGIEPGTTIASIIGQTMILSKSVSKEAVGVPISTPNASATGDMNRGKFLGRVVTATATGNLVAGSTTVSDVTVTSGTPIVGQGVTGIGPDFTAAGGHPHSATTSFGFNGRMTALDDGSTLPLDAIKDVVVDASRGFVGNALASPELCSSVEAVILGTCGPRTAVGGIELFANTGSTPLRNPYPNRLEPLSGGLFTPPVFSVEPEFGAPAQFAFAVSPTRTPYTFVPELRADEGYAVSFRTAPIITNPSLYGTNVVLCNFGATYTPPFFFFEAKFLACKEADDPTANPTPLITNPTRCTGALATGLKLASWQHPEEIKTYESTPPLPSPTDCEKVEFEPEAELQPINHEADTPTGMTVEIEMPIDGVLDPEGVSQANLNTVEVTLPEGMSINAASAEGLEACSLAQIKLKSNAADECPESSKVGNIEIDTPLIRETLTGDIYVAKQKENPFDATLGLYMAFDSPRDGVRIKVAGRLIPDPVTGRLTSVFTENPEAPFSRLAINFNQGPRSPLVNPAKCGTYAIHSEFSPWSAVNPANPTPDEIVEDDSVYEVTSGPNGSPCPESKLDPKLKAGLQGTQAGAKSPFVFSLSRADGTQRFNKIDVTTPQGLTASLKGIPYCPDNVLAGIPTAELTGKAELANPACPAASQVGTSAAAAGSGPFPYYASGRVYLAGPYKGAPVSLAVVTPATAGPFDLGNVVVRNPLYVDPVTSQVKTESDPIPTILHGIVLNVRDIRVSLDRPEFTQAPTSCEPMTVDAHVSGQEGADASVSSRFQVGGCEKLGFKPALHMRLFGGTKRGAHPKFRAILKPRPGDSNIASASVALPHSEFLDQAHIRTVCTRVQFAADQCPAGSIYGFAEATSPLLDNPVKGPAYLRSSSNQLPDLVVALKGPDQQPIEVHVAGRIDSVNGGIRSTFDVVPDQPVSSFTLTMQGGKKGLLVNSRDLCQGKPQRATGVFTAHNGKSLTIRPELKNACKQSARKGKNKRNKRNAR
ncbi:MAG TPA: hypothetical protein VMR96_04305 [Solirubrobacterales bacterium]|nr:hypothetical protein [Solirubrobacterales bacterium]